MQELLDTTYRVANKTLYYVGVAILFTIGLAWWLLKLWIWLTIASLAFVGLVVGVFMAVNDWFYWLSNGGGKPRFRRFIDFPDLPEKMKFEVPEELKKLDSDAAEKAIKENEKIQQLLKSEQDLRINRAVEKLQAMNSSAWFKQELKDLLDEEEAMIIYFLLMVSSGLLIEE